MKCVVLEKVKFIFQINTAQKIKFSIKDLLSEYDQIRSFLRFDHNY